MSNIVKLNNQNFQSEVLDFSGVVLVDFYADWCGPCQRLAPEIEFLAGDEEIASNSRIKIAKVDVDANQELATEYGIRSIPALFIFNNGQKTKEILGLQSYQSLKDAILVEINKQSETQTND